MAISDVDFLLELQRHAVVEGQTYLATRLCALLESRIEEERGHGRLTAEELFRFKLQFRENLALVNEKVQQVGRVLSRLKGDHRELSSIWVH